MIPKIIHYCWFGGAELPRAYDEYIREWAILHPGWTIKRWDESNMPSSIPYLEKALELKNWANLSNYIRLYALGREGGVYLDTDMKLLKPLDSLLSYSCFLGFEAGDNSTDFWVNNAILGAIAEHPFVKTCEQRLLQLFDGTEKANLSSPHLTTNVLKEMYHLGSYGRQQLSNIMLFEKEVFYPITYDKAYLLKDNITFPEQTIAVHTWGRTWLSPEMLLDEVDTLRRYSHELSSLNANINDQLQQSSAELEIKQTALQRTTQENNHLKGTIQQTLQEIERIHSAEIGQLKDIVSSTSFKNESQTYAFAQFKLTITNQIEQLQLRHHQLQEANEIQQAQLTQRLEQLHQQQSSATGIIEQLATGIKQLEGTIHTQQAIIQRHTDLYENSTFWQFVKRKLFKNKK